MRSSGRFKKQKINLLDLLRVGILSMGIAFAGIEGSLALSRTAPIPVRKDAYVKTTGKEKNSEEYEAFKRIGRNYILEKHDCDDMAQEYRDWLIEEKKVDPSSLRLVLGYQRIVVWFHHMKGGYHAWLEKLEKSLENEEMEWRVYDVAGERFNYPMKKMRQIYTLDKMFPGDFAYDKDETGYMKRGDKWDIEKQCWTNDNREGDFVTNNKLQENQLRDIMNLFRYGPR